MIEISDNEADKDESQMTGGLILPDNDSKAVMTPAFSNGGATKFEFDDKSHSASSSSDDDQEVEPESKVYLGRRGSQ